MLSKLSQVHYRLGRGLLARAVGQDFDLSRVRNVPKSLRLPLLRNGLDPVPSLAEVRAAEPVSRLASFFGRTIWVTTGSEEARALLSDPTSFSNDIRPLVGRVQATGVHSIGGLGFTDPPDHPRLRRILTPEFTVRRLERLRPRIVEIVNHQLQVVADAGPVVDLVQTFAFPIPFLVICELLGLPDEDREEFRRIGNARFDITNGGVGAFGAASESREFLLEATRKQRAKPGDGLLGAIITQLGDDIDDTTLSGLADGVFLGGYETTASMLTLGALTLLQSPEGRVAMGEGERLSPTWSRSCCATCPSYRSPSRASLGATWRSTASGSSPVTSYCSRSAARTVTPGSGRPWTCSTPDGRASHTSRSGTGSTAGRG